MANQERGRRGGITTAPLPPPVREKELAPPPTKAEVKAANAGELAGSTRTVERVGRNKLLKVGLIGTGVVGAGAGAYEAVPAFHQAVDSAFLDHIRGKSSEASIAETVFNPTATKGVIETIKRLPEKEVTKLDSLAKIDDHNTVLAVHPIDVSTSNKPDAKTKYTRGYGVSGNDQDRINREKQGYFSNFRFENVPAGSTILAPVDGRLILTILRRNDTADDHPFDKAMIEFQPREGETYVVTISGSSTKGGGMMNPPRSDVFRSLINAPVYESTPVKSDMSPSILEVIKQAIPVKKGQPILQAEMEINVGFDVTFSTRPNTDPSKLKIVGETIVNGEKKDVVQAPPTHLELFLSDGIIVQPQLPDK